MERTALGEAILKHWRENRPEMVKALAKEKRLYQAVIEAQKATADLLYELVNLKKMEYQAAWELATTEQAFLPPAQPLAPPPRSSTKSLRRRPRRGTSG